jgi:hypothetical protein
MLTNMQTQMEIIEGSWEEISRQADKFSGHRLRVVILPDADQASTQERLKALTEWFTLPRPSVPPLLDDSRAAIYAEDEDRG